MTSPYARSGRDIFARDKLDLVIMSRLRPS